MKAYNIRYLAVGHSYLVHNEFAGWQNKGTWGMAASEPKNDYFHRFGAYLKNELPCKLEACAYGCARLERLCKEDSTPEDYRNAEDYLNFRKKLQEYRPNLVSLFFGANSVAKDPASTELFYDEVFAMVKANIAPETVVLCIPMTETEPIDISMKKKAAEYGFIHVSIEEIHAKHGYDNPYHAFHEYPEYDGAAALGGVEFRTHPGDVGHDRIAQNMFAAAKAALEANLVAKEVEVPGSVSIQGPVSIQEETALTAQVCPENAAKDIDWSVDNPQICDIDENGVLIPKNNGTVTVTAASAYSETVFATKTLEITGQEPSYRVCYRDDSGDAVFALLADREYVRGEFAPQQGYNVARRQGYKFAGWRLDTGKEAVDTVVVDRNMTFYALWEKENG